MPLKYLEQACVLVHIGSIGACHNSATDQQRAAQRSSSPLLQSSRFNQPQRPGVSGEWNVHGAKQSTSRDVLAAFPEPSSSRRHQVRLQGFITVSRVLTQAAMAEAHLSFDIPAECLQLSSSEKLQRLQLTGTLTVQSD